MKRREPEVEGATDKDRVPSIVIEKPGLLTTVQDGGRWGHQAQGVPVAGPMDPYAHRLANLLVGNSESAATLEITLRGPEILFEENCVIALAGGDLSPAINDRPMPMRTSVAAARGSRLHFGARREGARAYLAVAGGIETPPVLGSRATHVLTGMGGVNGRALRAGDRLTIGVPAVPPPIGRTRSTVVPLPKGGAVLRAIAGPDDAMFADETLKAFESARFTISTASDRMAYQLEGPALARDAAAGELISDATPLGTIQVPSSGQPILLMADRQTCGGYPRIATLITADLALAGQLAPGDWIQFRFCAPAEALRALIAQERMFVRG